MIIMKLVALVALMMAMMAMMVMMVMEKPSVVVMVVAFCVLVFTMPGVLPAYMDNIILDYTTLCFVITLIMPGLLPASSMSRSSSSYLL